MRNRPIALAAAAAAVVLVVTGVAAAGGVLGDSEEPASTPSASEDEPLPPADDGHRWVSWRNVAVQVPEAWGYGHEPGRDWCADTGRPMRGDPTPYVALDPGSGAVLSIGCPEPSEQRHAAFGAAPESLWVTHLALEPADGSADLSVTEGSWTVTTRSIDGVRLRLLTHESDRELIDPVLDSARTFGVDHNGCEPSSPVQAAEFVRPEPFDVTALDGVDEISICQYQRHGGTGEPALMGSRLVRGAAADALLRGLQDAPPGTGPDRPQNCVADLFGDTAIAIRLHTGDETHDVHAYHDWCFGNGTDDGTQHRELTAATCAPLFEPPVTLWSYSSHLGRICNPDQP